MFAQDMVRGRIDPNRISEYHDFKRKNVPLDAILVSAKGAPDVTAYLEGLAPRMPSFKALQAEMKRVRAEASPTAAAAPITLPDNLSLKLAAPARSLQTSLQPSASVVRIRSRRSMRADGVLPEYADVYAGSG